MDSSLLGLVALLVLGTSIWAAIDAAQVRQRISAGIQFESPLVVFLGCLLLWIIAFPIYLSRRSSALAQNVMQQAFEPGERAQRVARAQLVAAQEETERIRRTAINGPTTADRIRELDSMLAEKLISAEEHTRKRAEILSQL